MAEPAAPSPGDGGLVRLRLDLGYDGSDFSGWAVQPGRRTVQGVVEDTLAMVLRLTTTPRTTVAGRTDAGVHARAQVCHVDLSPQVATRDVLDRLAGRLSRALPKDVVVHQVRVAPEGFHARFAALWRRYAYRVADRSLDPLRRREVVAVRHAVDVPRLNEASAALLGQHDFAAFCRQRRGATTVRTLLELTWTRQPDEVVVASVRADAFCHSMVRSMVGALLAVGEGKRSVDWAAQLLAAGVRDQAVMVAPGRGLTLEEVCYPADDELAARVVRARSRRR